ncbi:MAG TPA: sensor histidine kinase [Ramlibacter sp.]|uniref:sensor histidine kinase n=1 Tax=Ramlibacter sp. TaxID=1917967 RepID=UPI002D80D6F5|nr:sensor histidine kinase [Ramlibacter sp.]HET8748482.1 sensor histidine kinase [Ramlibacter sp.]
MQLSSLNVDHLVEQPANAPQLRPRLSDFIDAHAEEVLEAWDEFAATVSHGGQTLDAAALRDHASEILRTIAADLRQPQSPEQQDAKAKGLGPRGVLPTAAEIHADFRMVAGFAVDAMMTEYRALRASVLKLWAKHGGGTRPEDLTDLTRFNEAIDQAIAESIARYTKQTGSSAELFIGILGHDIRNPLGTILMSVAGLVRSGKLSEASAAPISNAATRIKAIIEQVVDFTRAQADGVMPIVRKPGDLAQQLARVVEETQVRHPARMVRMDASGDFQGCWDEGRMGQLLSNLLGNALLHGSLWTEVTVRMWSTPGDVCVSVHNYGEPIPEEERELIFQPLKRGAQYRTRDRRRDAAGLGLGLYICREIVLSHGGKLTIDSTRADGTTFSVSLPRHDPA